MMTELNRSENIAISFIIPVYNTEIGLLERGISSINKQCPFNKEVLLIDDGSKENLAELYDQLSLKHKDIQTIHVQNAGAANARNVGIEKSRGTYVIFIDADDYLPENDAIIQIKTIMDEKKLDFIVGANQEKGGSPIVHLRPKEAQLIIIRQQSINGVIELGSPWAKIFKRSFLIDNGIRFDKDLRRSHDRLFMMNAFEHSANYEIRNIHCYCLYIETGDSLSRSYNKKTSDYMASFYKAMGCFVRNFHSGDNDYTKALNELYTILHRQCAHQIYFHPRNDSPFYQRYKDFKKLLSLLGDGKCGFVTFRGISMIVYSILLKARMYFLLSVILEVNKNKYK